MRIAVLTTGSRGDAQPFAALGRELHSRGHNVLFCTHERFRPMALEQGLEFAPLSDELLQLLDVKDGREAIESRGAPLRLIRRVKGIIGRMLRAQWDACRDAQALLFHPKAAGGPHIAEKLGIPAAIGLPLPLLVPTRAFPVPLPLFSAFPLGGLYNRLTYRLVKALAFPYAGIIREWRREALGLPDRTAGTGWRSVRGRDLPVLHGISPSVLPRPEDWPDNAHMTGYWFSRLTPPPLNQGLEDFLAQGPPPVYLGFGSMAGTRAEALGNVIIEALDRAGLRGVAATGWGGAYFSEAARNAAPQRLHIIDQAPHETLFPHVAAVVHHGGAGTTAAGLRAGKPTLICPFMGDQFFWGNLVHAQGLGPRPIPQRRLTAVNLAEALKQCVSDASIGRLAGEIGGRIRAEDGLSRAADIAERAFDAKSY